MPEGTLHAKRVTVVIGKQTREHRWGLCARAQCANERRWFCDHGSRVAGCLSIWCVVARHQRTGTDGTHSSRLIGIAYSTCLEQHIWPYTGAPTELCKAIDMAFAHRRTINEKY